MKKMIMAVFLLLSVTLILGQTSVCSAQDIGLAWVGKSGMAERVTAGFDEALKSLAPDIKVEYKKELAGLDDLAAVVDEWGKSKKGMVILRSNGAKWLGTNPPQIPTFIGGCNNPVLLGAVKSMESPEGNVTGVTYFLPVANQFQVFKAILPQMKSVMLLLEKGHPSSKIDQDGTRAVCEKMGLEFNEKAVASTQEAEAAVKEYAGKVSVIIIGNQALNIDNAANIVKAAGKTPVLSYSSKPVKAGALAGFVADDNKLGAILAESLVDVLVKGKAVKDIPIKVDPEPKFFINAKTAESLALDVPYSILETATIIE